MRKKKISYQNIKDEDIIKILNNENYYNAILEYEQKRQISFDWDEPNNVTPYTFVIREFINNLSENIENKADIIQNFETFLQKQPKWIKLSKKEITELFIGYDEEVKGEEDDFNRTRTYEIQENNTKHSFFNWFDKKKILKQLKVMMKKKKMKIKYLDYSNKLEILIQMCFQQWVLWTYWKSY